MHSFCDECGGWAVGRTALEGTGGTFHCDACGRQWARQVFPLMVVTGASGVGKTAVIEPLRRLAPPGVAVFDKDLMWAADWPQAYNNFLRIASGLAQVGQHTVIVGTIVPEHLDALTDRDLVGEIVYANLHCDDVERARRLRNRPAWRRSGDDAFVERHNRFAQWLLDNATTAFGRPVPTIETDALTVEETAAAVAGWVRSSIGGGPVLHNVTLYTDADGFEHLRRFYGGVLGAHAVFAQADHIFCVNVSAGGGSLAICIHEAEPGHGSGTRELFLWVDAIEAARRRAEAAGFDCRSLRMPDGRVELQLQDPHGNQVRLHLAL